MDWFVSKTSFPIISGNEDNRLQLDKQLRLVQANDEAEAFEKVSVKTKTAQIKTKSSSV